MKDERLDLRNFRATIERQLLIIQRQIDDNSTYLEEYYEAHGDLYHRIDEQDDKLTEILKQPMAALWRLDIKSLLECLAIIDTKLMDGEPPVGGIPVGEEGEEGPSFTRDALGRKLSPKEQLIQEKERRDRKKAAQAYGGGNG